MRRLHHAKEELEHRVIALLDRGQVDFLDKISKDALFSTGLKLSRTKIISAMVDLLQHMHISGAGVKTPEDLENRIIQAMKKEIQIKEVK